MCAIIGIFNREGAEKAVLLGLEQLKNRGKDGFGIASQDRAQNAEKLGKLRPKESRSCIGHALHSIISQVPQPVLGIRKAGKRSVFSANCEIYNWSALSEKHNIEAENDAQLMAKLLDKEGLKAIDELDGDYAFAYWGSELILARDVIGVKPLFYAHSDGFLFASEKKVLEGLGCIDVQELNPRKILKYDVAKDRISLIDRRFFSITNQEVDEREIISKLKELILASVKKRLPDKKTGILFSGGVDSLLLAQCCKMLGKDVTCYTTALDEPSMAQAEDLVYAREAASALGLKLRVAKVSLEEARDYLNKVVPIIEDTNVTKAGVALALYPACEMARKDDVKVILSGLGSEEIFAGYERHRGSTSINKECLSGLLKMYERDTYRDDTISMANNLELRVPFLDKTLIGYALGIPGKLKIKDGVEKHILRLVADELGLGKFAWRKKRAAQYGSRMSSAIQKLTKRAGFAYKSDYLRTFYPSHNLKLGALVSTGKDSWYACHIMQRQNYNIGCLITIKSENPDSYMFHTPAIELVQMQSEASGIGLVSVDTQGSKEDELAELKDAMKKAKDEHEIDGIVTGALYSTYQRDRIERVCDELGLKVFSPLWHINQETEVREILDSGFSFILVSIAAEGLSRKWLGREMTYEALEELKAMADKTGFNIAGEGGEYETLVLDCPMFSKKIKILRSFLQMENSCTGKLSIEKVILEDK